MYIIHTSVCKTYYAYLLATVSKNRSANPTSAQTGNYTLAPKSKPIQINPRIIDGSKSHTNNKYMCS